MKRNLNLNRNIGKILTRISQTEKANFSLNVELEVIG